MKTYLRLGLALLLVAVFSAPAVAAGKRYIIVNNQSDATIDAGFLQPPTSTVLESYGTVSPAKSFTFTLSAADTKILREVQGLPRLDLRGAPDTRARDRQRHQRLQGDRSVTVQFGSKSARKIYVPSTGTQFAILGA